MINGNDQENARRLTGIRKPQTNEHISGGYDQSNRGERKSKKEVKRTRKLLGNKRDCRNLINVLNNWEVFLTRYTWLFLEGILEKHIDKKQGNLIRCTSSMIDKDSMWLEGSIENNFDATIQRLEEYTRFWKE